MRALFTMLFFTLMTTTAQAGSLFPPDNIGPDPNASCPPGQMLTWTGKSVVCQGLSVRCESGVMVGLDNGKPVCTPMSNTTTQTTVPTTTNTNVTNTTNTNTNTSTNTSISSDVSVSGSSSASASAQASASGSSGASTSANTSASTANTTKPWSMVKTTTRSWTN